MLPICRERHVLWAQCAPRADLGRFLAGEPIRARPVGPWERGVKWARRRPAWAAMLALSLFTALGAVGGVGWFTAYLQQALGRRTAELRA